ncbi:MAG: hypothetical protein J6A96_03655 [Clostridia bacterium]|nr:hypothetical protein [Clostridia bacterium]
MDNNLENNVLIEEKPKKLKSLLVFKIVGTVLYSLSTIPFVAFAIIMLVEILNAKNNMDAGINKVVAIVGLLLGAIACAIFYLAPIILGIIGLIRTSKKLEKGKRAGNFVWFILMIAVPVVSLVLEVASIFLIEHI